jgi:hypothetical protein
MTTSGAAFEAWRAYVSVGQIRAPLLRQPILRAWERSHRAGVDARKLRAEQLSCTEIDRLLCANDELVQAAGPYLRSLSRAAGSERHAVTVGDAQAVVLDLLGDDETLLGPDRVPGRGSLMAEAHAGVNGVATAIVEDAYVEIVGPEHFIGGFHRFTCQGVPLRGVEGETIGSLSISLRTPHAAARLRRILQVAARGIEADLIVSRLRARLHELPRGDEWSQLERLHQDLVQLHTSGRLEFELATFELSRAGDAEALIGSARDLIDRFSRLSRLWQMVADPVTGLAGVLEAEQLVRDSCDLMQTEARMAGVTLRTVTEPFGCVRQVHAAVHSLLHLHKLALDRAGERGMVEVSTDERGRVEWTIVPAQGPQLSLQHQLQVAPS